MCYHQIGLLQEHSTRIYNLFYAPGILNKDIQTFPCSKSEQHFDSKVVPLPEHFIRVAIQEWESLETVRIIPEDISILSKSEIHTWKLSI